MTGAIHTVENQQEIDHGWIFDLGAREFFPAGATLLVEGIQPDKMYLVNTGELSVTVSGLHGDTLARLGPGELIGEMAFLEGSKASATIVAERDTVVTSVSYTQLNQRLGTDDRFASQLYRAFALTAERRLRRRVDCLTDSSYRFRGAGLADAQIAKGGRNHPSPGHG